MVCLDTSFIVDVLRGNEKIKIILQRLTDGSEAITVTSPSIMELVKGAYLGLDSKREIEGIERLVLSSVVLDFDKKSAFSAGKIEAELKKKGEMIQVEDIMIAAIVVENNETLLTRNVKHFERIKDLKIQTY